MPFYHYKARDKFGKLVAGSAEAESESGMADKLKQSGYLPISIKQAKGESRLFKLRIFNRVKFSDLNMFTRQFYTLQKAGLPIILTLNALQEQTTNKTLKNTIGKITDDLKGGEGLSVAMGKHPEIFNTLYVNMIKAGEAAGTLSGNLEKLARLGESEEKIGLRIKSATRYPIIVITAVVIAFFLLTTFIVPRFAKLYAQFKVKLPLPTQILLGTNYVITRYWWLMLIIVGLGIFALNRFINTKKGRYLWDNFKLNIPVFGPLILKLTMSRFARITGTLMRSGIPILSILDLTREGVGNVVISDIIGKIKSSVNQGRGMVDPMKISGLFSPVVIQMIAVGEKTGKMDELLLYVADYYDSQIDYTVNNLLTLIEPFLIFVLGCGVLFMALSIFLPIWNLASLFRR